MELRAASPARDGDDAFHQSVATRSLIILTIVYMFNYMDRTILSILAQPIKDELHLSDSQIGFLGGIAFALFYTLVGIPIARLSDRGNRRNILAVCLVLWSGMTALCGLAQSFLHLFLARIGVAVGEAGGGPASHAMISDLYPASRRATALAVFALGVPIGGMMGNLLGGFANDLWGWRAAFWFVGLPGVLFAFVLIAFVPEPRRGAKDIAHVESASTPSLRTVLGRLFRTKSVVTLTLASALHAMAGFGVSLWLPSLFIRVHGWTTSEIGAALFLLGVAAMLGTLAGGYVCDYLGKRDARWYAWLPGIATLVALPFAIFTYLWFDPVVALVVYAIPLMLHSIYLAPTFSVPQNLVPASMRATTSAIVLFVLNLVAMGLGPQFVGVLSDFLMLGGGDNAEALRWAMIAAACLNIPAIVLYALAGRYLGREWSDESTRR